jgi:hypothetical protein
LFVRIQLLGKIPSGRDGEVVVGKGEAPKCHELQIRRTSYLRELGNHDSVAIGILAAVGEISDRPRICGTVQKPSAKLRKPVLDVLHRKTVPGDETVLTKVVFVKPRSVPSDTRCGFVSHAADAQFGSHELSEVQQFDVAADPQQYQ